METILLSIDANPGADIESTDESMRRLRTLLISSEIGKVETLQHGSPPIGAKGDPMSISALAFTIAPAALTAFVTILQSWLSRHQHASVTIESGDRKLTVTGSPSRDQQKLVEAFLNPQKTGE